jgi:hypothetical protein
MYINTILFKLTIIIIKPYTYACICTYFYLYLIILSIVFFPGITEFGMNSVVNSTGAKIVDEELDCVLSVVVDEEEAIERGS